jgi:hypothetical protein
MSQILDTGPRPPLPRRIPAHIAIGIARMLIRLSPRRIRAILTMLRRGAVPASYEQALAARADVVATSMRCAGRYCLHRSLATTLLCRMRGVWPTWCTGVRTTPFTAHAWIEVAGQAVGEPASTASYRIILSVPPRQQ